MTLDRLRRQIDRIDGQLLSLLNRRAGTAVSIGRLKKRHGLPVVDGRREKDLLRRLVTAGRGPLKAPAVRRIFRVILQESRKIQLPAEAGPKGRGRRAVRRVAYLGPEKTNAHFAALKKFGRKAGYLHAPTVQDVFRLVERKKADSGVVPIENSLEGAVTRTLDRFLEPTPVRVCGEIELSIRHFLITRPETSLGRIRAVFSHPQALAQCRKWLEKRLPKAELVETSSTADAVMRIAEPLRAFGLLKESAEGAAIGRSELAAEYRMKALPIPSDRENRTRFLVLGLRPPAAGRRNKTLLWFALKDKPGALHDALVPFKENRINLSKIESRPSRRKAWEYVFFIDIEGHESDLRVQEAFQALRRSTSECRVLGSYPIGGKG